ncbi:multicopper oxidase [Calocera viscosa TUFC12733]|uniref:Multicopper oxidase n=1 Tax=Calocera viscosa (strain TUFC12733) TaxID=1330018 RepID=A0A167H028_CALVF|nr:multicopper oxidase [Calocera viscosa TUFC12733]
MRSSLSLAVAASLVGAVQAAFVDVYWNITYTTANPDGTQERQVIGVNNTWPLPFVQITQGDTLRMHVTNGLGTDGTGLHTHGMYFNTTSYFDGAAWVTQCPIPAGQSLTYEVATDIQPPGSYWIHGHYGGQYVDGLRTPFIILAQNETYAYDTDYTIAMADWYHDTHAVLIKQFLNIYNPTGAEPVPDGAIAYVAANGAYPASLSDMAYGTGISAGGNNSAVLHFEPGKTYRIRFVSMSAFTKFDIAIAGHNMSIIEMDGVETEPFPVDFVPLSAAQRVSVLITARNDTSSNWPIMLNMDYEMFDMVPDALAPIVNISATIVYDESAPTEDIVLFDEYPTFWDDQLVPLEAEPMAPADVSYNWTIAFDTYDDGTNRASLLPDQTTYISPIVPSIFTQQTMGDGALLPQVYGEQTNVFVLNHLDMIELYIYNSDSNSHPFHLHGHKFQVVAMSQDITSDDPTVNQPLVEGQDNPARRDTLMIPAGGSVNIRFRADNPGTWMFHCHIEWHLEAGLAVIFAEAPPVSQQVVHIPQVLADQCNMLGSPSSGNVVGLNSTTDFSGQAVGPFTQYHLFGWIPRAQGAMAGCILAALLGMACVVWYAMNPFSDFEHDELAREKFEAKQTSGGKFGAIKNLVHRKK